MSNLTRIAQKLQASKAVRPADVAATAAPVPVEEPTPTPAPVQEPPLAAAPVVDLEAQIQAAVLKAVTGIQEDGQNRIDALQQQNAQLVQALASSNSKGGKGGTTLKRPKADPLRQAVAQAEADKAGFRLFYLSETRFIQKAGWAHPKLVHAAPEAQVSIKLSAKVVRQDRDTGEYKVVDRSLTGGIALAPSAPPVDNRPGAQVYNAPSAAEAAGVAELGVEQIPNAVMDADTAAGVPAAPFVPPAGEPPMLNPGQV